MDKKEFKIKEFAQIFGLSADAIRYYENCGLLKTKRDESNHYRYYTEDDCSKIMYIRLLRSLGFSINDIREHRCMIDEGQFEPLLNDQMCAMSEEIDFLTKVYERLKYYAQLSRHIIAGERIIGIEEAHCSYWFYEQMYDENLVRLGREDSINLELYKRMPLAAPGCVIEHAFPPESTPYQYVYGLIIDEKYLNDCKLIEKMDRRITWERCLHIIVKNNMLEDEDDQVIFSQANEYINEHKLDVLGDIVCSILPMSPDSPWSYLDCHIPIR